MSLQKHFPLSEFQVLHKENRWTEKDIWCRRDYQYLYWQ